MIGIVGILTITGVTYVPNTSIYFDTISALFVIGVAFFYVLAVGGSHTQRIGRFGKAALHAATLGFFIGLSGIAAMDDPPVAAHQLVIFVMVFGYVISFAVLLLNGTKMKRMTRPTSHQQAG
jgi:O-antigen/teichoic acid export membrane protein